MPEHTPAPTPARGVYGFVMYLIFKTFFIIYVTWALVPESWFESFGITYLPKRYWAITVPVFLLNVLAIFAFIIYPSLGLLMTPNIDDITTIKEFVPKQKKILEIPETESDGIGKCCMDKEKCRRDTFLDSFGQEVDNRIRVLEDLSISEVCRHLYLR